MEKVSEKFGSLVELLESRDVDVDTRCGIVLTLKTEENYLKMQDWIKKHPKAGQTEIMRYLHNFLDIVPYYVVPKLKLKRAY